ncbi:MAG TPA: glutathione peroxidase [Myxococcales bacterium]|jgi:glutathione peroxidase|nr:glutathione peroxidase [Myxococcales bacterium]
MSFFDLEAKGLDGAAQPLSAYKGKVALVVNVASECGFTPQYTGLQALSQQYKDKGLVVLGFPSNEFGGQEPGNSTEIAQFCSSKFHVTFPMFEKVNTKGAAQSPVYAFLTQTEKPPKWNFHKYLVGKDGQVLQSFASGVTPESAELKSAIDAALAK